MSNTAKLALELKMTDKEMRGCIAFLERLNIIVRIRASQRAGQRASEDTVFRLLNWSKYQNQDFEGQPEGLAKRQAEGGPRAGSNSNQEAKKPRSQEESPAANGGMLLAQFIDFRKTVQAYKDTPYIVTGRDRGAVKELAKSTLQAEAYKAALPRFFSAPAQYTGGHSAAMFFGKINEYLTESKNGTDTKGFGKVESVDVFDRFKV